MTRPNVQYYANTAGKGRVRVVGNVKSGDFYGIAFPKGSPLVAEVNKALATLKSSGEYDAIYIKWFGKRCRNKPLVRGVGRARVAHLSGNPR